MVGWMHWGDSFACKLRTCNSGFFAINSGSQRGDRSSAPRLAEFGSDERHLSHTNVLGSSGPSLLLKMPRLNAPTSPH
jgi:hypothetical protein